MPFKNKEDKREFDRQWIAARKAEWFKDKVCAHCGTTENLELDHIDESTKETHRIWSWSKVRREAELAKCQPLCETCHKKKTKQFLSRPINHGTTTGYHKGCRCPECHFALLKYWRERRKNFPR